MISIARALLSGLGKRVAFYGTIILAVIVALWIAFRQGRQAAAANFAIRHDVQNCDRADLERRAHRWMRD